MYTKENITIKNITSKTSIKPELGCVAFCGDRTIATDSFRLIEVAAEGDAHEPVLYNAKMIQPSCVNKDGFEHDQMGLVEIKANYPDIDQVLDPAFKRKEDDDQMATVRVDPKLLGETLIAMSKSGAKHVELSVPRFPGKAIIAETYNSPMTKNPSRKVRALVMPLNQ